MYWQEMREEEFASAIDELGGLCLMPLMGMEKHGQHLPVGTDSMVVNAIIDEALKIEDTVVFPAGGWLGDVSMHYETNDEGKAKWRGAIELSTDLQMTLIEEMCDEIRRCGFRKVLIIYKETSMNLAGLFTRHVEYERRNFATMIVPAINAEKSTPESILKTVLERKNDFSNISEEDINTLKRWAEEGEKGVAYIDTSLMLAIKRRLVAKDRMNVEKNIAEYDVSSLDSSVVFTGMNDKKYPYGIYSEVAEGCTEAIGEAILKINAEHLASVFRLLKADEECIAITIGVPMEEK